MENTLIYVTVGHYGSFDDYSSVTHYAGSDKEKAFNEKYNVCDIGAELKRIHVEVWKNEKHIQSYNEDKIMVWELN